MEQVALNIIPRLPYSSQNFVLHEGVEPIVNALAKNFKTEGFSISLVIGLPRSGKTHLVVYLTEKLSKQGLFPNIIEGNDLPEFSYKLDSLESHKNISEPIFIDNIHEYLLSVTPGESGQFVSFVEWCRRNQVKLLLTSSVDLSQLPCDDHVMSRLRAAVDYTIGVPSDQDLPLIIEAFSRQRGVKLSKRYIDFLIRRLGRDLLSLEKYIDRLLHLSQVMGRSIKSRLLADAL